MVVELDRPVRIGGGESSRPRTSLDYVPATALLIMLASDFFVLGGFWGAVVIGLGGGRWGIFPLFGDDSRAFE